MRASLFKRQQSCHFLDASWGRKHASRRPVTHQNGAYRRPHAPRSTPEPDSAPWEGSKNRTTRALPSRKNYPANGHRVKNHRPERPAPSFSTASAPFPRAFRPLAPDPAAYRACSVSTSIQPRRCSKLRPVAKSSPHRNARRTQREITWYQGGGLQADQGRAGVRRGGLRGGSLVGVENGGGGRRGQSERGSKKASTIASIGSAANNRGLRSALTPAAQWMAKTRRRLWERPPAVYRPNGG